MKMTKEAKARLGMDKALVEHKIKMEAAISRQKDADMVLAARIHALASATAAHQRFGNSDGDVEAILGTADRFLTFLSGGPAS